MNVIYTVEPVTESLISEMLPILEEHRIELSRYKDMILSPDIDTYLALQDMDKIQCYLARENGIIVGYSCYFLLVNPHYSNFIYAHQDVFYVVQDKRGSKIAHKLIKMSETELKEKNVSVIVHHAKLINRFGEFLISLGYNQAEIMYHKRIQ